MITLRWHYDEEYKAWFTRYRGVTIECKEGIFYVSNLLSAYSDIKKCTSDIDCRWKV